MSYVQCNGYCSILKGLFQPSHMQYELDRENDAWGEPSLTEMVEKSIDILERADNGYFLLVEGRPMNFC